MRASLLAVLAAALLAAGCRGVGAAPEPPRDRPYVLVLGTAQDGGLPHIGCNEEPCRAARLDPARRRLVSSLLLCDPRSGKRWLLDCSPDLAQQVERARAHPPTRRESGPRPALFDGIFLTHAHMGHYGGLLQLGREAYGARSIPTHVTPRMAAFLRANGPWSLLVAEERLVLHELAEGTPVALAPDLALEAFRVPHRDELSDTVGFRVRGPRKTLVYLPDIDKWEAWDALGDGAGAGAREGTGAGGRIEALIAGCDLALLDGSFFADGEIPGRSMADIPHPFVRESLARFARLPEGERAKVRFTHLNHTNPAADPASAAARAVRAAGMRILADGEVLEL